MLSHPQPGPTALTGGSGSRAVSREGLPETAVRPWCKTDHTPSRRTPNTLSPENRQGSLEGGQGAVLSALEKAVFGQM